MRSTYDRDGGNRTADASHFLYAERPDFNVALDILGRGVLYFVRTNHWHGSPWHYVVDGTDVTYCNLAEARAECALSMHDVRVHVLSSGDGFDLKTRKPLPPKKD